MKKFTQEQVNPSDYYEVINQYGEQLTSGTYMECLAYVNNDGKGKELTIEPVKSEYK